MANKEFIEERIKSVEEKIKKSNTIILKKKALILKKQNELNNLTDANDIYWKEAEIRWLEGDITSHESKIEKEYKPSLEKYKAELEKVTSIKRDIPVLVEFLNRWKEAAYNFYVEDANSTHRQELKDEIKEAREAAEGYYKSHYSYMGIMDYKSDTYKEYEKLSSAHRELLKNYNQEYYYIITIEEKAKNKGTSFEEELDKNLQEEWQAKYDRFISDTQHIVGNITDCAGLSISGRGELNGIVVGDKGKAKVTTFLAGHYHKEYSWQQCLHYRCKITKLTENN